MWYRKFYMSIRFHLFTYFCSMQQPNRLFGWLGRKILPYLPTNFILRTCPIQVNFQLEISSSFFISDHEPSLDDCKITKGKFLCNDKLRCIDIGRVCDEESHCFDGSDEGGKCDDYGNLSFITTSYVIITMQRRYSILFDLIFRSCEMHCLSPCLFSYSLRASVLLQSR